MKIEPKPYPNGKGYYVAFHHPVQNKTVRKGLDTQDLTAARSICIDAVSLFSNDEILQRPTAAALVAFERKACELVFGRERVDELLGHAKGLTPEDVAELKKAYARSDKPRVIKMRNGRPVYDKAAVEQFGRAKGKFSESLRDFDPRARRIADERRIEAEKRVKVLTHERDQMDEEIRRLRRERNVHVKTKLGDAVGVWKKEYEQGHADQTRKEAVSAVESFRDYLESKGDTLLRDVNAGLIDKWVADMKREEGSDPLSPVTKATRRRYLSTFFSWAFRRYDMHENPIGRCAPIAGAQKGRAIKAIDRLADIRTLLAALEPHPYWHAWVAFAIFLGPRLAEQRHSTLDHVYLDGEGDVVKLVAHKTGRERKVPVEQTIFKPILAAHCERRKGEIAEPKMHPNLRTSLLFPSLLGDGMIERTKSEPGVWSHARAWHTEYGKIVAKVSTETYYWKFGPDEWRHTFGTMLAHCGWTSLEISRAMDNSPAVAERHYIMSAGKGTGARWPLKF